MLKHNILTNINLFNATLFALSMFHKYSNLYSFQKKQIQRKYIKKLQKSLKLQSNL